MSTISSRSQCLRVAAEDGISWAEDSAREAHGNLVVECDGVPPDGTAYAEALRAFDQSFAGLSESPARVARVPARWAPLYDATIERAYRREIRRRISEALAS